MAIKIQYDYAEYKDCEEATAYSHEISRKAANLSVPLSVLSVIAIVFAFASVNDIVEFGSWQTLLCSIFLGTPIIILTIHNYVGEKISLAARSYAYYLKCKGAEDSIVKQVKSKGRKRAWAKTSKVLPYAAIIIAIIYSLSLSVYLNPLFLIATALLVGAFFAIWKMNRNQDNTANNDSNENADTTHQSTIEKKINAQSLNSSIADEIREYKKLFDEGIITQEEFDAKKKQLLGL